MSTTVTYKGTTLGTVSNETRTLDTAGWYLDADIALTDVTGSAAISVVDTTDSHGGTIRTITAVDISDTTAVAGDVSAGKYFYTANGTKTAGTATSTWSWMGNHPTLVKDYTPIKVYLKDTGYATWTPSTTAAQITTAEDLETYTSADFNNYEYMALIKVHTHFNYINGPGNGEVSDYYYCQTVNVAGFPTTLNTLTNDTISGTRSTSAGTYEGLFYTNGATAYTTAVCGVRVYSVSLPASGILGSSGTITLRTPGMAAACLGSVFTTSAAAAVDQDTSFIEIKAQLWQVDRKTAPFGGTVDEVRDMLLNGF